MKETIFKDLAKTKDYTLKVAEAMPEKQLDFKPAENVMSFRELIHHMAYSLLWIEENCMRKTKSDWAPPAIPSAKKALIDYLNQSFERVEAGVQQNGKIDDAYTTAFYFMIEHNAHHRGQAVTYLRCNNVTPPDYPF